MTNARLLPPGRDLIEYANKQGAPAEAFVAAGWRTARKDNRPALLFKTAGGYRWRFVDGKSPKYTSQKGYQPCWYGLHQAARLAGELSSPLILCNGEAGTVAAQYHGVPACCITSGEGVSMKPEHLAELRTAWAGPIIVAYDSDIAGVKAAQKRRQELREAGYEVRAVALGLKQNGDLADFCQVHDAPLAALLAMPNVPESEETPVKFERREAAQPKDTADQVDWAAWRLRWWSELVLPRVEQLAGKRRGKHFRCINPNHEDRNPSARISTERNPDGVYICTCCMEGADRADVATWAGAPDFMTWWRDQNPLPPGTSKHPHFDGLPEPPGAAELLPDARAAWDALPAISSPERMESDTSHYMQASDRWPDWSDGLLFGWLSVMCAVAGLNTGVIFYLVVTRRLHEHFTIDDVLTQGEQIGLQLSWRQIDYVLNGETGQRFFTKSESIESLEYRVSTEGALLSKSVENPLGGRPKGYYRLAEPEVIRRELLSLATSKVAKWAYSDGTKRLPVYWRRELLEPLLDSSDDVDAILAGLERLTEQAKEANEDFAAALALYYARWSQAIEWIRKRLNNSDLINALPLDGSRDSSPAYILGAAILNYDVEQAPQQKHSYAYDQWLTGVSDVPRVRKAAKLRYCTGEKPREFVPIPLCDPADAVRKVNQAARTAGGKPLKIWYGDPEKATHYSESNIAGIMALVARNGGEIKVELSVSAPLERYEPQDEPPATECMLPSNSKPPAPRRSETRQPRGDADDQFNQADAMAALAETVKSLGWQVYDDRWVDPDRQIYPAHWETVLQAAVGVPVRWALQRGRDYVVAGDGYISFSVEHQGVVIQAPPKRAGPAIVPILPVDRPALHELTRPTIFTRTRPGS